MVFVTVGTAIQGFARLLEAVDRLVGSGYFSGESVFMQTGSTREFVPRHCEWKAFVGRLEFERLVARASLIVCHGGTTVLEMIRLGKVPVVMPRRGKYGELVNDHQLQLVEFLAAQGRVVPAWEPEDLAGAVVEARGKVAHPVERSEILVLVAAAIQELTGERERTG